MSFETVSHKFRITKQLYRPLLLALVVVGMTCFNHLMFAQLAGGSITGIVKDQSGQGITNAEVTAINTATNQAFHTSTSSEGYFTFPVLQASVYKITVHAQGFKEYIHENIKLDIAAALEVDASLSVGQVSETVTVTTEAPLLETENSSLGQVIPNRSVDDLPLDGRNSYGFASLVPGVNAPIGFSQTAFDEYNDQFLSINGSRPNQNQFLLDGGQNSEPAFTGPGYYPSVDVVSEYKVETNNLDAEYSHSGGGVINVITKSGSNKFHGSGWEFFRNTDLVANDYFSNLAGLPRADFKFNQFGGTFGGPIIHNKTFFFFGYEGLRWVQAGSGVGTIPTALQRSGDFSQTVDGSGNVIPIYDPKTTVPDPANPGQFLRTQYPGNKIPLGEQDPVAVALLAYLPPPNQPGTSTGANNYITNFSSPITENSFSLRIDHAITGTQSIFGRYSINDTAQTRPNLYGTANPNYVISSPTAGTDFLRQQQATVGYTNSLRSNVVLDLNSSYIRYFIGRTLPGYNVDPTVVGLPSYFKTLAAQQTPCFPTIGASGQGLNLSLGNIGGGFIGGSCYTLSDVYPDLRENGTVTVVHGKHSFKFGADFGIAWLYTPRYEPAGPTFNFSPGATAGPDPLNSTAASTTGVGLASFMSGDGQGGGGSVSFSNSQYVSSKYWGIFAQDAWRISQKLTLNIGLRYDYDAPWTERHNRLSDFDPTITSPVQVVGLPQLHGGLTFPGVNGVSRSEFDPYRKEIAPRLGFAYSLFSNFTVRGGYGIFFAPLGGAGYNGNSVPDDGFSATTPWITTEPDGVTPLNFMANPFPLGFNKPTGSSAGATTYLGLGAVGTYRNRQIASQQQWNLDTQTVLPGKMLLDVAYAGGRGDHLYGDYNPDQLPDQYLSMGSALLNQVPNPFYGNPLIQAGGLSGTTVSAEQLLLPFPQFSGVTYGNASSFGASLYNSLQAKLVRRFANGFSVLSSYTWSKLRDNIGASETGFPGSVVPGSGIQDWDNLKKEWSVAEFDVPHYWTTSGIYELPFGKGRKYLKNSGKADYVIGGWQLEGINSFISGYPVVVYPANQTLNNNGGFQRANWNGQKAAGSGRVDKRLNSYFNVAQFSAPAPFTYGNSPRLISSLRTPITYNTDLSFIKKVKFAERFTGEFRFEAFNVFNHPLFGGPDTALGDGRTGIVNSQVNLPRQVQVAGKITF
jgi:hypothetical protein